MSDGREEREERKLRIEQEKKGTPEGWVDREDPTFQRDEWEPERVDS